MTDRNEFSQEIHNQYRKTTQALVNTYCQCRNNHPYEEFPKLAQAIRAHQVLVEFWATMCQKLGGQK